MEDEAEIASLVRDLLQREKFVVDIAANLRDAKFSMLDNRYRLVMVDRMLPDGDGIELVRYSQRKALQNRFLILSAMSSIDSVVEGLDLGADDYIGKPFEPDELLARVRAVLRRPQPEIEIKWSCGDMEFEKHSRKVTIHGDPVTFARRELAIIEVLIQSSGSVVIRDRIESAAFSYDDEVSSNAMEAHISRTRKTLSRNKAGVGIYVVRGVGYIMKEVE